VDRGGTMIAASGWRSATAAATPSWSYDGAPTYQTIAAHGDEIEVVIPPRSTAVPSGEPGPPTQRDRHLAMIAEQGRVAWQVKTGYSQRSLVETTMGRYKARNWGKTPGTQLQQNKGQSGSVTLPP